MKQWVASTQGVTVERVRDIETGSSAYEWHYTQVVRRDPGSENLGLSPEELLDLWLLSPINVHWMTPIFQTLHEAGQTVLERMLAARHHCERRTRNAGRTTDTSKRGVGFYRRVRESQTVSLSEEKKKVLLKWLSTQVPMMMILAELLKYWQFMWGSWEQGKKGQWPAIKQFIMMNCRCTPVSGEEAEIIWQNVDRTQVAGPGRHL